MNKYIYGIRYGFSRDIPPEEMTKEIYIEILLKNPGAYILSEIFKPEEINEVYLELVKRDCKWIKNIPEENLTEEICLAAISQQSDLIKYIPEEKRTENVYLTLIQKYSFYFQEIPEDKVSERICLEVVRNGNYMYRYIPESKRNEAIYLEKLKSDNWFSLREIPENKRTEEMYKIAVKKQGKDLQYIPEEERTKELCMMAVNSDGLALQYVPGKLQTDEMYFTSVQQKGGAIWSVPKESRTEELLLEAVKTCGEVLSEISKEKRTKEVCMMAVKSLGYALRSVPEEICSEAIYLEAVKQNWSAIQYVPEERRTEVIYLAYVQVYGENLKRVPEEKRTEAICLAAVQQNIKAIQYVPEERRTEAIYLELIKRKAIKLSEIPKEKCTEAINIALIETDGAQILADIPEEKRTERVYVEYIKKFGEFEKIPENKRTEEIYLSALERIAIRIREIPENKRTEKIYLTGLESGAIGIKEIPENERTEKIYLAAVNYNIAELENIPEKYGTEEIYLAAAKRGISELRLIPKDVVNIQHIKIAYGQGHKSFTDKDAIEICKNFKPHVLVNSNMFDELSKAIEEVIGDNSAEKEKLGKIIQFIKQDKSYAEKLIQAFYDDTYENPGIKLNQTVFPNYLISFISKTEEFEGAFGKLPDVLVVDNWENSVSEYNEEEYKRLLKAGIIEKSSNYREEEHKKWILKMYQVFGYENSLKLLEEIPEVSEEMMKELIEKNEKAYNEIFEKKYILTGEIQLSVDIIHQINAIGGKNAFAIFKKLNKAIELGEGSNVKDLLIEEGIEDSKVAKIEHGIKSEFDRKKLDKVDETLRNSVNEQVSHQQGRIHDLIFKVIKQNIQEGKEITKESLLNEVVSELHSKNEAEEYIYSSVIRDEEENIKSATENFITHNGVEKILNDNIVKMLGRTKDKIGQGWIRKLLGISLEMNENEYKTACEKLGQENLEHEEEIKLKGKDAETKEKAMELLNCIGCPELITFEKLEVMFGSLRSPFSKEFGEYFLKHKDEIMHSPEMIENFAKMHNAFETIIKNSNLRSAYEEGRLELKTVFDEALNNKYIYGKGEAELATLAREAQLEAIYWEDAREIFKITREREETTIPPIKVVGKKYRGRMLRVDDPLQLFVGDMTGCCQRFGDPGEGAMLHAAIEKNGGIFVIEEIDEKGNVVKLVAQSWTWRNDDVLCFDNIEVKGDNLTKEEQEEVLQIYKNVGEQAIKTDIKALDRMLKNGKITQNEYDYYTLKEVRIGLGYNHGMPIINEKMVNGELEKSYDEVKPKEAGKKYKVGNRIKEPWIDSKISIIIAKNEQMGRVAKKDKSSKVSVSYRKSREVRELQGQRIDEDAVDIIKQIESEVYREEQQVMKRCNTVEDIAEIYDCDVDKLKVSVSRDKDWYAMYYDKEDSIYILQI